MIEEKSDYAALHIFNRILKQQNKEASLINTLNKNLEKIIENAQKLKDNNSRREGAENIVQLLSDMVDGLDGETLKEMKKIDIGKIVKQSNLSTQDNETLAAVTAIISAYDKKKTLDDLTDSNVTTRLMKQSMIVKLLYTIFIQVLEQNYSITTPSVKALSQSNAQYQAYHESLLTALSGNTTEQYDLEQSAETIEEDTVTKQHDLEQSAGTIAQPLPSAPPLEVDTEQLEKVNSLIRELIGLSKQTQFDPKMMVKKIKQYSTILGGEAIEEIMSQLDYKVIHGTVMREQTNYSEQAVNMLFALSSAMKEKPTTLTDKSETARQDTINSSRLLKIIESIFGEWLKIKGKQFSEKNNTDYKQYKTMFLESMETSRIQSSQKAETKNETLFSIIKGFFNKPSPTPRKSVQQEGFLFIEPLENSSFEYALSLRVIGDPKIGKDMVKRFTENIFTKGIDELLGDSFDFKLKTIGYKKLPDEKIHNIKLLIYPPSPFYASTRCRTLKNFYYKRPHVFLAVFDMTNKDSFDNLKSEINEVCQVVEQGTPIIVLAGTKKDAENEIVVSEEEIKEFAEKRNIPYVLTSAEENVNEAFYTAVKTWVTAYERQQNGDLLINNSGNPEYTRHCIK